MCQFCLHLAKRPMENLNTGLSLNAVLPPQILNQQGAEMVHDGQVVEDKDGLGIKVESVENPNSDVATREKRRIANRLQGFNPKDNTAWYQITQKFGSNIKQPELLSIAEVCANSAGIKLDRDAKRRKSVLIKWFDENWPRIQPFLNFVILEDTNKTPPEQIQAPMGLV